MPVGINGTDHNTAQAGANLMPNAQPLGLTAPDGLGGFLIQASGILTLTTAQWDARIEGGVSSTGLAPGTWYYVGCDTNKITPGVAVPGAAGPESTTSSPVGARLGFATSTTDMLIRVGDVPLTINLPNNGAALGMPVVVDLPASTTVFTPGQASVLALAQIAGIFAYSNADDSRVVAFTSGMELELTTAQWDARTGGAGGLSPGERYYLSATAAGGLVTTPPVATGDFAVSIGSAISATRMAIQIGASVGPHT